MSRPSADQSFMEMAHLVAKRTTCTRRGVGAVLVSPSGHVLATGRNGPPRGVPHADEVGCLRTKLGIPSGEQPELCRGLHAEANAIIQVAREGGSTVGAQLYVTNQPCGACAKMIVQAGIIEVIYSESYPDEMGSKMLAEGGVSVRRYQLGAQL